MTREPGFYWVKMAYWDEAKPVPWNGFSWEIGPMDYHNSDFTFIDKPENRLIPPEIK